MITDHYDDRTIANMEVALGRACDRFPREFECPKCEHIQKTSVEDPMEFSKAGWTKSDLNPPK